MLSCHNEDQRFYFDLWVVFSYSYYFYLLLAYCIDDSLSFDEFLLVLHALDALEVVVEIRNGVGVAMRDQESISFIIRRNCKCQSVIVPLRVLYLVVVPEVLDVPAPPEPTHL